MPKIIENLEANLIEEARKQISEQGYAATTIRSVARGCGVGVGTVYNYFPSKEMLVATFVFEEWKGYLHVMSKLPHGDPKQFFKGIYDALTDFAKSNEKLFSDVEAAKLVSAGLSARHKLLRRQIAEIIVPFCESNRLEQAQFAAEFLSETILCWAMEKENFETVYPFLEKIIK